MTKKEKAEFVVTELEKLYPETPIPLDHSDSYTLLIAVLLSAQCTDLRVNKTTPALFSKANCPEKMILLDVEEIKEIIRPCGLSPKKSKAIHELSKILIDKHQGNVPESFELLEELPENVKILPVTIKPGEILCFSGSHLHSSSKHKSENTRFSYEIRTVCQDDLDSKNEAPNIDCELKWQFPKIFRNMKDNSPMKITS